MQKASFFQSIHPRQCFFFRFRFVIFPFYSLLFSKFLEKMLPTQEQTFGGTLSPNYNQCWSVTSILSSLASPTMRIMTMMRSNHDAKTKETLEWLRWVLAKRDCMLERLSPTKNADCFDSRRNAAQMLFGKPCCLLAGCPC